jgi:hypothetical protein
LGIGDWGFGGGGPNPKPKTQTPKPKTQIPNPQSPILIFKLKKNLIKKQRVLNLNIK